MEISEKQRLTIVKSIISNPLFLGDDRTEEEGVISFLELILDLHNLPSTDPRFENAYDDCWQHLVRNNDWNYEYVFLDRFSQLYKSTGLFEKFVSFSVHPSLFAENEKDRNELVDYINNELLKIGYRLLGVDYFEQRIVYIIAPANDIKDGLPNGIPSNMIPFYFGHTGDKTYPCFVLQSDPWDDWFKYRTKFRLLFYTSIDDITELGFLKIMKRDVDITSKALPANFFQLADDWCSIGLDFSYYDSIKSVFPGSYNSILYALKDTAVFPSIHELFEDDVCFNNSLLRKEPYSYNNPAPLLDSVRWQMIGVNVESYYKFKYTFLPPYAKDCEENYTTLNFDFTYNVPFEQRIYGIIGKNGSGKTTLLSQIAQSFQSHEDNNIIPRKPLYNKVISISFSVFNSFPQPEGDARFNYRFLGLNNNMGDLMQTLRSQLRSHLISINNKERMYQWYAFLEDVLHEQLFRLLSKKDKAGAIDVDNVMKHLEKLSSGENLLIYIFSSLLDEIKHNTLILFDEPETHLHPNAISSLLQYMYSLLEQYNSFCVLATHSPLVIQEIPSDNVIIFRREEESLTVQPLPYETFSQDLSIVTENVFGDISQERYHHKKLTNLVRCYKNYDQIIDLLSNSGRPVPIGTRMMLKSMLQKKNA